MPLLTLLAPSAAKSFDVPVITTHVSDFAYMLHPIYRTDLNRRLTRFAETTGYAIYVVTIEEGYSEQFPNIAREVFESNQLEAKGLAGTALLFICAQDGAVAVVTSKNLQKRLTNFPPRKYTANTLKQPELAVETGLNAILNGIDRWFYVLDWPSPPFDSLAFVRSPTAEIILFATAPLFGLMTGLVLMAFTSAGTLPWLGRFFVSGYLGCCVVVVFTLLIRQPGGIVPGMFYYGASMGFAVSGTVGALRPFWFNDAFKGKKSHAWWVGPVHFWRG
jgi:uncharacterized membrane protein YgcG